MMDNKPPEKKPEENKPEGKKKISRKLNLSNKTETQKKMYSLQKVLRDNEVGARTSVLRDMLIEAGLNVYRDENGDVDTELVAQAVLEFKGSEKLKNLPKLKL